MSNRRWTLSELLDIDFFLRLDEGEDLDRLTARDRKIQATFPQPSEQIQGQAPGQPPRQTAKKAAKKSKTSDIPLLRHWLAARKTAHNEEHAANTPGAIWQELFLAFSIAVVLAGFISGAGMAFSFLAYSGTEPINVTLYFTLFVLLQVALFLLLGASSLLGYLRGSSILEASLLYKCMGWLFSTLLQKLTAAAHRQVEGRLSAENRLHWAVRTATLKQLRQRYGLLFLRPFFLLGQLAGISFNCGVLAATLLKVIGADLAFGWQTTLQVESASVHLLVQRIALPWSWLPSWLPIPASPTLEQVEGSRLILKEGIYHLANRDLAAWWPFLCLAVLCYGLLPRLVLFLAVFLRQRRQLSTASPDQGRCRQLLHRMRSPVVSTKARVEARAGHRAPENLKQDPKQDPKKDQPGSTEEAEGEGATSVEHTAPIIVLLPDELASECPQDALEGQILLRLGYHPCGVLPFWTLEQSEAEELAALHKIMGEQDCTDILLLHEAWQPPVQELLSWLGLVRQTIGEQATIVLALIGKPSAATLLTPVNPQDMQVWQKKIALLNDSGIQLIDLVKREVE